MNHRKWIATALAMCMLLPTAATAVDIETEPEIVLLGTGYIVNPYGATIDQPSLISDAEEEVTTSVPEVFYETKNEAAQALLNGLKAREETIAIGVTRELYTALGQGDAWNAVFDAAIAHDPDDPKGGDYTGLLFDGASGGYGEVGSDNNILVYNMTYRSTKEQEDAVDEKVDELVTEWKAQDLSEYDTIKTIYDYITANVTYDEEGLLDETDLTKFTAYGALYEHSAVCMGISILFYRLALEMDVDARFIQSIEEEYHAWDIVKFGDDYYNVDATWDLDQYEHEDRWFLKNMADFQVNVDGSACHTRMETYLTDAWMEAYPMAEESYRVLVDPIEGTWNEIEWEYDENTKTLTIGGAGEIPECTDSDPYPWQKYAEIVEHVVIEEGITEFSYSMLEDYGSMETLSLPATVTKIEFGKQSYFQFMLRSVTVAEGNPNYVSVNGVLYDKDMTALYVYPDKSTMTTFTVPDTVKEMTFTMLTESKNLKTIQIPASVETIWNINCILSGCGMEEIDVAKDNPNYCSVDGVLYSKDMTILYQYPNNKSGKAYTIPDSVTEIKWSALTYLKNLETLYMGNNVANFRNVGIGMINHSDMITAVYFSGDLPDWFATAFTSDTSTITFYYPTGNTTWTDGSMTVSGVTYKTAAYDVSDSGDTDEPEIPWNTWNDIKWYYDEDSATLTIGGEGEILSVSSYPWSSVKSQAKTLVFQEGITTVPGSAFSGMNSLTTLSIPASMKNLATGNPSLFASASKLSTITAAEGSAYFVQDGVLYKDNTLVFYPSAKTDTSYTIPEGIKTIGAYAFPYTNNALTELTLPNSLTSIDSNALNTKALTTLHIPAHLCNIDDAAFVFMNALTAYTVDSGNALYTSVDGILYTKDMTKLVAYPDNHPATTLTLPDTVTDMDAAVLHRSKNLKTLTLPASLTTIRTDSGLSGDCDLEAVLVDSANESYCSVDGVLYSKDMTTLYYYPVNKADTTYHIPDSVTTLLSGSMWELRNLKTLYFGTGITSVVWGQFATPNITSFYFPGDLPSWFHKAFVYLANAGYTDNITFYYPTGATGWTSPTMTVSGVTYKTAAYDVSDSGDTDEPEIPWNTWNDIKWYYDEDSATLTIGGEGEIPECTDSAPYPWQEHQNEVKHVVIDEGITEILSENLYGFGNMQTLTLPSTLSNFEFSVLNGSLMNLQSITVTPGGKYDSEDGVLFSDEDGERSLLTYPRGKTGTSYEVPDDVQCIQELAFFCNGSLKELVISKSVKQIQENAFGFNYMTKITVDADNSYYKSVDGVLYNKDMTVLHTYPGRSTMTTFTVPDTVKEMTYNVLTMSSHLKQVYIPASVEKIWEIHSIESGCTIEEINVAEDNPNYCSVDGVLYSKDMCTLCLYPIGKTDVEYTIPDTVKLINNGSLTVQHQLKTLRIGKNVESVKEDDLLHISSSVTSIYFPGDFPNWFKFAFSSWSSNYKDQLNRVTFYYPTGNTTWTDGSMTVSGVTYKTAAYTPTPMTAEDLTGDGIIDAEDLALLVDYFSGKTTETIDFNKADFDGDGDFDRADVMYLARALANWEGYTIG